MKGYTIQHSIDLLEKAVDSGGGSSSAADVSYDNTESGLTATNVQTAIDELSEDDAAADVTYDNTVSGLVATNVQSAIDELAGGLTEALTGSS